jgi:hypothetical protein
MKFSSECEFEISEFVECAAAMERAPNNNYAADCFVTQVPSLYR